MLKDSWKIKPLEASGVTSLCTLELTVKLHKRPDRRSENWYVRIIIPAQLQSIFKAERFVASTKTSDKVLARARAAEIVTGWERKLYEQAIAIRDSGRFDEQPARPTVISQDIIELLCTSHLGTILRSDDEDRIEGLSDDDARDIDQFLPERLAVVTAVAVRGKGATKEYAAGGRAKDSRYPPRHLRRLTDLGLRA